ncbi:acyl-CoA/acyl-ACP dehydrogenase [Sphingobium sp. JS3065]|jgi:alkylation response protein AidB-like acyl-CoA dehydrogenase|uniref:acyl-CoA dehydrogenase family protein n=1 Tax=Sphingobium sp. JS3065 TaxID=2970925 RepID=UPI0022645705|nr:acyl-CoA dehydrogenase family protein [Sphingobium sp. JS3065]UZW57387.1 acyl-CoA/acyl-ACP dehydrogenase [Sphingobium sp. JS3065]
MDFNLSDLQRMLLDSAERYIGDHYSLEHRRSLRDSADGIDHAAWQTFAELGWLSILVPEELGGLGGSMADVAVLAGALGNRCVREPFTSSAVLSCTLLAGAGETQGAVLESLVAGEARITLAHDEPGERYDYRSPRAVTLAEAGGTLALSGQKMMVLDAPSTTHFIVSAQGADGLALVLVAADSAGVSRTDYALYDDSRAADVAFDRVAVSGENILASGAAAEALLGLALDRARIALAAQSVGAMEAELEICSAYLKERQQFGQAIGKFQALQHIMADMFVAAHQARSMLYFALSQLDAQAAERERAVALARVHIAEAAQLVSRQSIQLHGGYGVTDEYEVSHHYRRQLIIEKLYGDLAYSFSRAAA